MGLRWHFDLINRWLEEIEHKFIREDKKIKWMKLHLKLSGT